MGSPVQDWRQRIACYGTDPTVFEQADLSEAQRLCGICPVRAECLADALKMRDVEGFRAGLTGEERHRLLPRRGTRVPVPVLEIVRLRVELGWTVQAVTVALGVPPYTVHQVMTAVRKPRAVRQPTRFSTVGLRRRRQALGAIGHSLEDIARRLGVGQSAIWTQLQRQHVSRGSYERWCRVYTEMSQTAGGNETARRVAARLGWAPPEAWTTESIDDPAASPDWDAVGVGGAGHEAA